VTARRLDGTATAREIRDEVARGVASLGGGVVPGLTVVLVGEHPASMAYVRGKEKAAREAGMRSAVVRLPATTGEAEILATVRSLNDDAGVHGILVQLPLPPGVDARRVLESIDPEKDVDGFHPVNAGRLLLGLPGVVPCTPAGVVEIEQRRHWSAGQHVHFGGDGSLHTEFLDTLPGAQCRGNWVRCES
jgi:methylenetetrahydrofolate dehydrogenase (NADP+)/methenyltetrahydrofolate cyclohydrolase